MVETTYDTKNIVLDKNESLLKVISKLKLEEIKDFLLTIDERAINLSPYDNGILNDINRGHWDIYNKRSASAKEDTDTLQLPYTLTARSPLLDIKSGTVAIDFGTKSTVAGFIDERSEKQLIRIGCSNIHNAESAQDYENPTIIEFRNINLFLEAYRSSIDVRPATSWKDLLISHEANHHSYEADNQNFYRFFSGLKQWAGSKENKFRIKDLKEVYELKDFLDCGSEDINPIEIYAYYIGRYINNMRNGIYLKYLLSYPVKYSKETREKIRQSFENGIKKSIPSEIFNDEDVAKKFKVILQASEPAAYAITALKEYGFLGENLRNKQIHYGIFDFGGGTTDFDFGTWKTSLDKKFEYELMHFGEGGDPYLGGENLLELLAFEVFKKNKEIMRANNCSFIKPENEPSFGGSETLIQPNSQEAKINTTKLVEILRDFWEHIDDKSNNINQNLETGSISIILTNNNGEPLQNTELEVNLDELKEILTQKIENGVEGFFQTLQQVSDKFDMTEYSNKLHIFLAGNSSRSPLLKEIFERKIEELKKESEGKTNFELFPPLGTPEANEKLKEMRREINNEEDLSKTITCKTGVIFGLLDSRKGGGINIKSEIKSDDVGKFGFYLGVKKSEKFLTIIDPKNVDIEKEEWHDFWYPDEDEIEIYYTPDARANSNNMSIKETKLLSCTLDQEYPEGSTIKIQIASVNSIKYAVFDENDNMVSKISKEYILTK